MIFSTEDDDEGADLSPIDDLREEVDEARAEYQQARQRESEVERRIEKLESKADVTEREAKAEAVLPGQGAAQKALKTKAQEAQDLRQEAEELRGEKQEARQRLEAAEEELDGAVVEAIPELLEELETHTEEHREALVALADKTLHNARILRQYREERAELIDALNTLLNGLSDPDRRVNHARRHRVRSRVKAGLEDPVRGEGLALNLLEELAGYEIEDLEEEPKTAGRLPLQRLQQ